jgi:hypothetical protein
MPTILFAYKQIRYFSRSGFPNFNVRFVDNIPSETPFNHYFLGVIHFRPCRTLSPSPTEFFASHNLSTRVKTPEKNQASLPEPTTLVLRRS